MCFKYRSDKRGFNWSDFKSGTGWLHLLFMPGFIFYKFSKYKVGYDKSYGGVIGLPKCLRIMRIQLTAVE